MLSTAEYHAMNALQLYRTLLKSMRAYPSKNRFQLIVAMQEEFRQNKTLTDQKKI